MRVLVACEFSGVVREAFRRRGHDAWSCDLLPAEDDGPHLCGDAWTASQDGWDLMIAHPPCTYLAVSGARWFSQRKRVLMDFSVAILLQSLAASYSGGHTNARVDPFVGSSAGISVSAAFDIPCGCSRGRGGFTGYDGIADPIWAGNDLKFPKGMDGITTAL